ncbi:uncharacterized protein LOC144630925 [Oculina patagonica]
MAAAPDPDKVLSSTRGKGNFQRLARLLISGGTTLLREVFDLICPPSSLSKILKNPATEKQLKAAKLNKPQWDCLYPSPGVYGKSEDCDVTLLFKLLRTICNLIPPVTGWDALPTTTDHSLAADLVRIKYYRNSVYGHVSKNMEITDDDFPQLWQEIREALVAIAGQISPAKKIEWQEAINNFLKDPLTAEDERNVQELLRWYENDTDLKQSMEKFKASTQEGMERLETSLKGVQSGQKEIKDVMVDTKDQLKGELKSATKEVQCLEKAVREEAQDIKDQLGGELKTTAQKVQGLVRDEAQDIKDQLAWKLKTEAQDIKDKLDEVHQSIDELRSTAGSSQASGVQIRVRIDCEAISSADARGGASKIVTTSREPQPSVQSATVMPVTPYQQQASPMAFCVGNVACADLPPTQAVLNFIAYKYFQAVDPSNPEELNEFVKYLRDVRNVLVLDAQQGSLIITLECSSLEILDGLWEDYCSGHLNEMAQKNLATEEVLKEFGLMAVKLTTTILVKEYKACRRYFLKSEVHPPRYNTREIATGFGPQVKTSKSKLITEEKDWKKLPLYKVALCGKKEVGKTSIFRRLRGDGFKDDTSKFDNLAEAKIKVPVQDKTIEIDLWDTSGMERYGSLTRQHYFGSHVVLLVYDCDDMESLQALLDYYRDATINAYGAAMVLVCNKIDKIVNGLNGLAIRKAEKLLCNHEVMGRSVCTFKFRAETSAKENTGIQELIREVAEYLLKNAESRREFGRVAFTTEPLPTRRTSGGCC